LTAPAAPRPVDVHALPAMLTALRLPSFQRHWQALAERADAEGWPASRFLAALAEIELAERDARRIQRHLQQSQLPGGKTLATLDFKVLPGVPRARIEALAAGDWVETGANLIAIGNSGVGKSHVLCAIGHALVEAGKRVLYTSTTDMVQKLQAKAQEGSDVTHYGRDLAGIFWRMAVQDGLSAEVAKQRASDLRLFCFVTGVQTIDQVEQSHLRRYSDALKEIPKSFLRSCYDQNRSFAQVKELARAMLMSDNQLGRHRQPSWPVAPTGGRA
jgi:nucleotide-binding universal stress UspA family protein